MNPFISKQKLAVFAAYNQLQGYSKIVSIYKLLIATTVYTSMTSH